ncbi:hypothetical protein ABTX81_30435 [Kitasatospora sp. NPDC097605]|uniref:hypothetical protein n=1 Tax=Kitasatospora sp. NPDC097605 TaxID=3157226 RepID=UPI00331F83C4
MILPPSAGDPFVTYRPVAGASTGDAVFSGLDGPDGNTDAPGQYPGGIGPDGTVWEPVVVLDAAGTEWCGRGE